MQVTHHGIKRALPRSSPVLLQHQPWCLPTVAAGFSGLLSDPHWCYKVNFWPAAALSSGRKLWIKVQQQLGGNAQGKEKSSSNTWTLRCIAACGKSTYPQNYWEFTPPDGLLHSNECPSDSSFTRMYCTWVGWMKCTGHETGKAAIVASTLPVFYFSFQLFSRYMWKFRFLLQPNCNSFVGRTDDPILTENLKNYLYDITYFLMLKFSFWEFRYSVITGFVPLCVWLW